MIILSSGLVTAGKAYVKVLQWLKFGIIEFTVYRYDPSEVKEHMLSTNLGLGRQIYNTDGAFGTIAILGWPIRGLSFGFMEVISISHW